MKVRKLGPGDESRLARAVSTFRGYRNVEPLPFFAHPNAIAFVAEDAAEITGRAHGYVLRRPEGRSAMFIYELEVADQYRRRGFGTALIQACLAEGQSRGCFKAWLLTERNNQPAIELYRSTGAKSDVDQAMLIWELSNDAIVSRSNQQEQQ